MSTIFEAKTMVSCISNPMKPMNHAGAGDFKKNVAQFKPTPSLVHVGSSQL